MRMGTSHFVTRNDADVYYAILGYSPADVQSKLDAGEINIGKPEARSTDTVLLDPKEGRYHIEDNKA